MGGLSSNVRLNGAERGRFQFLCVAPWPRLIIGSFRGCCENNNDKKKKRLMKMKTYFRLFVFFISYVIFTKKGPEAERANALSARVRSGASASASSTSIQLGSLYDLSSNHKHLHEGFALPPRVARGHCGLNNDTEAEAAHLMAVVVPCRRCGGMALTGVRARVSNRAPPPRSTAGLGSLNARSVAPVSQGRWGGVGDVFMLHAWPHPHKRLGLATR